MKQNKLMDYYETENIVEDDINRDIVAILYEEIEQLKKDKSKLHDRLQDKINIINHLKMKIKNMEKNQLKNREEYPIGVAQSYNPYVLEDIKTHSKKELEMEQEISKLKEEIDKLQNKKGCFRFFH